MQPQLTPRMVESAYRYLMAAKHLKHGHDMLGVAQIVVVNSFRTRF